jgi:hypothetical protein
MPAFFPEVEETIMPPEGQILEEEIFAVPINKSID